VNTRIRVPCHDVWRNTLNLTFCLKFEAKIVHYSYFPPKQPARAALHNDFMSIALHNLAKFT
jgi:hypothetical protein